MDKIEIQKAARRVEWGLVLLEELFGPMKVTLRGSAKSSRTSYHAVPPYRCNKIDYEFAAEDFTRAQAQMHGMNGCRDCDWKGYETEYWRQQRPASN
ncbi:hypothetical protein [Nonomuraea sp. NPDC048826]|uniref:hypothetical protein n=1 Tax=Nonomuraea sp. NPDC048826 TaxID=3364347 RepID=UPI003716BEDA